MNNSRLVVICGTVLILMLLLFACVPDIQNPSAAQSLVITQASTNVPCEACAQATLAAALTQGVDNANFQAAATAELLRVNAQSTLDSANATLGAVQTQDQNNANVLAAQIAATLEIERANAQATLSSAGSTQSAALTQDAINQTQVANIATSGADAILLQQNKDEQIANTQTAIANQIATQTQVAVATSQWYTDQARQRTEQRQGPIAFLWMWCLPVFILLLAGLAVWGFWRWLRIQQANQRILVRPVERLEAPRIEVIEHQHDDSAPYLESDLIEDRTQPTPQDDQVHQWLDEVKSKLLDDDKKAEDDNPEK
ncbi:MAG: hypothetical protein ABI904_03055 [Chloroflexota bacterium]